jgi:glutamate/tyrosine decarboxylase-like PLP-dependent enzyme
VVLRWLKELFGLPSSWAGALTSGATLANLIGLGAARQRTAARLGFDAAEDGLSAFPPISVLASETVHASVLKALGTLGLGRPKTRVPARAGRMDVSAVRARLAAERGPVVLVAGAGEVNTGAFDDFEALADLRDEYEPGCWLHVDAAFGLFAGASPGLAHLVRGIERADSVAADGHKWLNVPYDCGFALVRDEAALRGAFATSAPYLSGSLGHDADDFGPEMSRRFRALAAWCALKAYGRAGYRALVERCVAHASELARFVEATDGLELLHPARLNVVLFRASAGDDATRSLVRRVQEGGEAFVTGTVWDGKAAVRAAFDGWATSAEDVRVLERALAGALEPKV